MKCPITGKFNLLNYECDCDNELFKIMVKYDRGMYTAKQSKFDEGYAYAMKLCIMLAKGIEK